MTPRQVETLTNVEYLAFVEFANAEIRRRNREARKAR
jgi:hypothetical protein